jgi:hypothetical protein
MARAYSMDLRLRVLQDAAAGVPSKDLTARLEALIQEQPDRTLLELKALPATSASLPAICRAVRKLGYRINAPGARASPMSRPMAAGTPRRASPAARR